MEIEMKHALYIQWDIEEQILDDFLSLPVSMIDPEPFYRHCSLFPSSHTWH